MDLLLSILALLAGQILIGLLHCGVSYLYGKSKGACLYVFTCLFLRWERDNYNAEAPGKIRFSVTRLNQLFPTILMYSRTVSPEEVRKHQKSGLIVYGILAALFLAGGIAVAVLFPSPVWSLILKYVLGGGFLYFLNMAYFAGKAVRKATGLMAKVQEIREAMLKNDISLLPNPAFAYEEYSKAALGDKLTYLTLFYRYAEIRNDLMAMAEAANAMTKLGTATLTESGHFHLDACLFSYYSFRQKDPSLAQKYYKHSKKAIDRDSDCNGRRRLAYYAYYIQQDRELARKYLEEGIRALSVEDPRMSRIERDLEERMLLYLKSQLDG